MFDYVFSWGDRGRRHKYDVCFHHGLVALVAFVDDTQIQELVVGEVEHSCHKYGARFHHGPVILIEHNFDTWGIESVLDGVVPNRHKYGVRFHHGPVVLVAFVADTKVQEWVLDEVELSLSGHSPGTVSWIHCRPSNGCCARISKIPLFLVWSWLTVGTICWSNVHSRGAS
jgi:hypothetical protein